MALIVGHCAVGARRQSSRRQSAERETACWGQRQWKYQGHAPSWMEWCHAAQSWMQIVALGADGEQWYSRAAPSCWCSTGDGWTTWLVYSTGDGSTSKSIWFYTFHCQLMSLEFGHLWLILLRTVWVYFCSLLIQCTTVMTVLKCVCTRAFQRV